MSFGGSVSAMISSIKNNTRAKRKTFFDRDETSIINAKNKRNFLHFKQATPEQLNFFKKKLILKNKRDRISVLILFSLILFLTIIIMVLIY